MLAWRSAGRARHLGYLHALRPLGSFEALGKTGGGVGGSCRRFSRSRYLRLLWSAHTSSNVSPSGLASFATVSPRTSRAPRSTTLMVVTDTPLFSASSSTVSPLSSLIRRSSRPNHSSLTPRPPLWGVLARPLYGRSDLRFVLQLVRVVQGVQYPLQLLGLEMATLRAPAVEIPQSSHLFGGIHATFSAGG